MSEPAVADEVSCNDGTLNGLAEALEADSTIRSIALHKGSILQWPDPAKHGCIHFESMSQNYTVLKALMSLWCPRVASPATIPIDQCRKQAR